ncbi:Hsp70 family protein [Endozoicomonas gorgoniicola]|uniref:Hsp70 family protein n=1 Tax=Endozoicomonas gorgoniicola TaxID=1234144 RepID=A0ABT3MV14_9GAMM|nr:Hsp70 family protein [Endozoicomonas gorgoniicola]MCW7552824.1 Hsp70 family protein [Endozoicomonas gorgoniicola]
MIPIYITSSIGITTEFDLFHPIFNIGTELPCRSSKLFISFANEDDKYLSVKIHQGNNCNSSYNSLLKNINIKKNVSCHKGQPQLSLELEVARNSVMTIIAKDLMNKKITTSYIEINSSSTIQLAAPQLENIEHIVIAKKMSHAKRLVRINKKIIYSIKTKDKLVKDIIDRMTCVTQQIEHILNQKIDIEDLEYLLEKLSDLSWRLNILAFTNHIK